MPINRKYPLDTVLDACRYYVSHTGRRITMEYALMHEVNDTVECARELAALLKGMLVHVNLIPVNHVVERDFVRTPPEAVQAFQATLRKHHINTTIRREQGHDIAAACGQLRAQYMASNR
jgi:23S rRNA (adenine2503-C2)-methyltransferase